MLDTTIKARLIAFYLPQYHPIPENDKWWGKGFTEWTNVTRAKPLFRGHHQPHLPADLGFYDLRLPEVRQAQADLATEYGIYGFCYYHYWFHGRRVLERPFNEVLTSLKPNFPFCLCWANENWTRVWDGLNRNVLLEQTYSEDDDKNHIDWLINVFKDERYIKIDNKPLFLVYRASELPDPLKTTQLWRDEARKAEIGDLFLCKVMNVYDAGEDPASIGFDAAIKFQPSRADMGLPLGRGRRRWLRRIGLSSAAYEQQSIYDYQFLVQQGVQQKLPPYKLFESVTPSWDNSARRKIGATLFVNSTPQAYEAWLRGTIGKLASAPLQERLVFINAWNEWAEGNHLEPDQKWGHAYLAATRRAVLS